MTKVAECRCRKWKLVKRQQKTNSQTLRYRGKGEGNSDSSSSLMFYVKLENLMYTRKTKQGDLSSQQWLPTIIAEICPINKCANAGDFIAIKSWLWDHLGENAQVGSGFHQTKIYFITIHLRIFNWTCRGLNLGPSPCQADVPLLIYGPSSSYCYI